MRQQLSLPLPITAQGELRLRLQQGEFSSAGCRSLAGGVVNWQHAQLATPLGALELANVQGQLSCDGKGALVLVLKQDSSHLSLTGRGTVGFDGRYQFNGQVRRGPVLPETMRPLINQLGRANDQGQIPWQVQGRLL
ncbi:Type II secretion system protein N [compost metagenome]